MRNRGANNIRWAFHINFPEYPDESWNAFENYYPGNDVIDIIGVSIFSAQLPTDEFFPSFESLMDPAYSRLIQMAPKKPVFVFEFAATAGNPLGNSVTWADEALAGILSGRWPAVRGFAWWNDHWENDSNPSHNTEMRVEAVPGLARVFKSRLSRTNNLGERPPIFMDKVLLNHIASAQLRAGATLKTLAEKHGIRFGAMYQYVLRDDTYDRIFETEMNVMAAGTFWGDGSRPSRTEFDLSEMDTKVSWGLARHMELHGHTLVWFAPTEMPDWLKVEPATNIEAIMNEHIDTVVKRYAGKIKLWDVVNEPIDDDGTLRQKENKWFDAMGDDYIRKAFIRAHAADPAAVLRLNEYDLEINEAKFKGVKALLSSLKDQDVPVHALGWQLHIGWQDPETPTSFNPATLLARMNEIADLGFDNYITELDVALPIKANEADYKQQKQIYKAVIETFLTARRHKTIVVWGLRDGDPEWLTENHPLLFDENLNKKSAYSGVQEAFEGLAASP
jgi:endo-1,4-beta-xylanase